VLRGVRLPPGFSVAEVQSNRKVLSRLPAAIQHDILHAYSISLHPVFLTAVPIALVAFVLSWFLREVPLRTAAGERLRSTASAADLGEGMGGSPTQRTSEQEAERVLTRLSGAELRRFRYNKLARAAGLELPGSGCWVLARLARQGATPGPELAQEAGVTVEEGHPVAEDLISRGLITRSAERVLALTPMGHQTAEKLFAAERKWLESQLVGWSPEQHADLEHVLSKLSRALLGDDADRYLLELEREGVSVRPAAGPLLSRTEAR
jgi:DNA-binding MarR family transcriptional regulator